TLLIVDDEPEILDALTLTFEEDFNVLKANGGRDALAVLESDGAAVIIADQRMPEMMGEEFLEKAREMSPDTVRMMLTGFADFAAIVDAINKGQVYRYISKPWEPADLEIDVRTGVERYALQHSLAQRMRELKALCEIGATITSTLDSEQVIQKVLDGVVGALGFDRSHLMLVDEKANRLVSGGSAGVDEEVLTYLRELEYDLDREDVGVVLTVNENRPILVEDVDHAPIRLDMKTLDRIGFRSFVTAPISAGGRRIGVLVADRVGAGERVTEHDQRLLMSFADQAAIAMGESARSAAALITAYERAREDASAAAEVAGNADAIALTGKESAERLSANTARIESVVTLISGIAHQTRLLALNASIEAARAGDSGRGFAVVAQEVRTLADQAADATGGVTRTIREAQAASAAMAETNRAILGVVTELLARVRAVSGAMEAQMATVAGILASIDETAVSSREIAALIATISLQVGRLAGEAEEAGRQAALTRAALGRIEEATGHIMTGAGQ
ncbi:MAG: response regulator, partial [Proteobacteria bacterium]|nr:response regulator [Pseudomonadota bacterium]